MTDQSTAAAERSFHDPAPVESSCHVCGGPFRTCSHAARCLPPLVQVCSAACSADARFSGGGRA